MKSEASSSSLREHAVAVVRRLRRAGFVAYWAGGCVRDLLRGAEPKDYDVATGATPDEVCEVFPGAKLTGKSFGVVRVHSGGHEFEVATFRQDRGYADGRHPEAIAFADPETDARRRDFTINALFHDPLTGETHDFVGGIADLNARLVRTVGRPEDRFAEDHLRMLRAARFSSTLEFRLDPDTADAIRALAPRLTRVSAERIRDELTRILLESPHAGGALRLIEELGIIAVVLPEVAAMKGLEQPPEFHPEGDVFTHTVLMLDGMKTADARLAFAVLLHDVGKPATVVRAPDRIRFHEHAERGAEIARAVMTRLRFPSDDIETVAFCVGNHMRFMSVREMRRATLRRLVGSPTFPLELELHRLDCLASHRDLSNFDFLVEFQRQLASEPVLPAPWITGHDILALGIPTGPEVGRWHRLAYDAQIEGRFATPEELRAWLGEEMHKRNG